MSNAELSMILRLNKGSIILAGLLVSALSFLFLVLNEENYRAQTDYLVVQNNRSGQQDFYTLSRSAEYSGRVISEAIRSELFISEVMKSESVSEDLLPAKKIDRLKEWNNMVKVNSDSELGILGVSVLHDDRDTSINVSEGIKEVLTMKNHLFRGYGQDIDIRVLTGPVYEKNPTVVHVFLSLVGGFIFGAFLMFMRLFYMEERVLKKAILK